ncbi:TolB-like translocation protein [Parapedobacter koreensis]|uniref:WD40-like Beta Propeller Repeat n=1 Tax=Parapedobacter koreensis TaxID=332977 RepID=A0A1H7K255_9SPHI|nr:PD40 domain-containing protein [Parapedobacter koreensis]SEK80576.1 WD40-like Beta Propeller Repeat [Parapedobacter koreensis]
MINANLSSAYIFVLSALLLAGSCTISSRTSEEKPRGNRIGFFDENNMNLCTFNELDGSIDALAHIEESTSGMYRRTVWSPDGSQFAFTGTVDGVRGTYIADADGSNRPNLTELTPSFSLNRLLIRQ